MDTVAQADVAFAVEVSDTQTRLKLDPDSLVRLVRQVLRAEGVQRATISLAIVDDATIQVLNRRHLEHDWPTDVISFLFSEPDDLELSGELVVSAETALTTARDAAGPAFDELALYLVHGLLHLLGHDDTTDAARSSMRKRESELLASLGLVDPHAAVALANVPGRAPR